MTLVKASRVSVLDRSVRLGADAEAPLLSAAEHVPAPEASRLSELERELRDALERVRELERSAGERESEALERGRAEGEHAALARLEKDWSAQQTAFLEALATCVAQVDRRFADLEAFALDLAETALAQIVGDTARRQELMAATIAHHLGALGMDTVVAVHVSAEDVPDAESIAARLPPAVSSRVRVADDLASGACRVDLLAGSLNLGLGEQAARLAETMERLRP